MMTEQIKIPAGLSEKAETPTARTQTAVGSKIRAGVVGAGLMGFWHAHAIEKAGGEVVGIADFDAARAKRLAARHKGAKGFGELEKMLAEQNPQVLHVCSPTASHEAIAAEAVKMGVHLLIEKPVAATAPATARLFELASRHGRLLCPVHQFVFQDGTLKAGKMLPRIGRLTHLEAEICSAGGTGAESLDRIAADILPHPLSLMQTFLGEEFSAAGWDATHPSAGELRIYGQAARGASLAIFISLNSRPTRNSFRLVGTDGTIHLDLFHGFSFFEPGRTSRTTKILHPFDLAARNFSAAALNLGRRAWRREPAYPGLRRLIREFYAAVRGVGAPPLSPAGTIAVAEIRDRLLETSGIEL